MAFVEAALHGHVYARKKERVTLERTKTPKTKTKTRISYGQRSKHRTMFRGP